LILELIFPLTTGTSYFRNPDLTIDYISIFQWRLEGSLIGYCREAEFPFIEDNMVFSTTDMLPGFLEETVGDIPVLGVIHDTCQIHHREVYSPLKMYGHTHSKRFEGMNHSLVAMCNHWLMEPFFSRWR